MKTQLVQPIAPRSALTYCAFGDSFAVAAGTPHIAFCYRERLDPARMRRALSQVLDDFHVYAGRVSYREGAWQIDGRRGGAAFEVAESSQPCAALGAAAHAKHSALVCPQISVAKALNG